ncbi:MAG: methylenetetrahydrofolate reductase [Bacteroidales bacterium]
MKVIDHISNPQRGGFSLEILPPLRGKGIKESFEAIDPLVEYGLSFINVTSHRNETQYYETDHGNYRRRVVKRRPGTVGICSAIQSRYKIDAVPHLLCGGFTRVESENLLIDLNFLEIENIMALRGDPVAGESYFTPEKEGNRYASELVHQIAEMNRGNYLASGCQYHTPTSFCIGVAGYPEKHIESPAMESDLNYLKKKVEQGAHYIITQMFFDNTKYLSFVERCREEGIEVPILPGIKPLSTKRQLNNIPHKFKVDLPNQLVREVERAKTDQQVREIGIEWAVGQCRELLQKGAPLIHFFSNGKTESIVEILKRGSF